MCVGGRMHSEGGCVCVGRMHSEIIIKVSEGEEGRS